MIKIKKAGFTLPEVLITLAIVGTLAALVLPGLIKDANNRSMMALLQGTVANLNNAVQNELVKKGTSDVTTTDIYNNPVTFLQNSLDVAKTCTAGSGDTSCYAAAYKTLNGSASTVWANHAVLLKNGVALDILTNQTGSFSTEITNDDGTTSTEVYAIPVGVDLNSSAEPNILGIDRHIICIYTATDDDLGIHSGDVGGCLRSTILDKTEKSELKTNCNAGNTEACYVLAEQSGFDSDYLNQ